MIGLSSYLVSRVMVANLINVHYYERYVNLVYSWLVPWKTAAQVPETSRGLTRFLQSGGRPM
jgi:hypothetical protein